MELKLADEHEPDPVIPSQCPTCLWQSDHAHGGCGQGVGYVYRDMVCPEYEKYEPMK
jgi:hypothetical protein